MSREEQIRQSIEQAATDGKVPCAFLLGLARQTQRPPKEIGHICDELDIRISKCQLGCFG